MRSIKTAASVCAFWLLAVVSATPAQVAGAPGVTSFGTFDFSGPAFNSGVSNYQWLINDAGPSSTYPSAPGTAGPSDASSEVSGWGLVEAVSIHPPIRSIPASSGNFYWDATPSDPLTIHLSTLLGPYSTVSSGISGAMADFDPTKSYSWAIVKFQGAYGTHNTAAYPNGAPTDSTTLNASTIFDLTEVDEPFVNAHPGGFGLALNGNELDLTYTPYIAVTPVPEPGTMALVGGVGLLGAWRARRRRGQVA